MYYTVIKHDRHLRTRGKCGKHEPQASVFYISRVFSNDWSVLSQCNTRLRLLHLLYDIASGNILVRHLLFEISVSFLLQGGGGKCCWFFGCVPGFLGGVPGFLRNVPGFLAGVPGFWQVFRVFLGCSGFFGCCGMFRDVPVFLAVLHADFPTFLSHFGEISDQNFGHFSKT